MTLSQWKEKGTSNTKRTRKKKTVSPRDLPSWRNICLIEQMKNTGAKIGIAPVTLEDSGRIAGGFHKCSS